MGDRTLAVSGAGAEKRDGEGADKLTVGSQVVRSHSLRWERRAFYIRGELTSTFLSTTSPLHSLLLIIQLLAAGLLTSARNLGKEPHCTATAPCDCIINCICIDCTFDLILHVDFISCFWHGITTWQNPINIFTLLFYIMLELQFPFLSLIPYLSVTLLLCYSLCTGSSVMLCFVVCILQLQES